MAGTSSSPGGADAAAAPPRRIADLPGPPGLPFVGNLLQIDSARLHQIVERWRNVYGDAYRLRIANREFVVLSDPEVIAGVLRDRPDGFQRSTRAERVAAEMGMAGLFAVNGAAWRRQRPMVMASFDPKHIRTYFPSLVNVTARLARRWQRAAASGEAIDLQADLMRYTVDVTAGLAFGCEVNTLESDGDVIQHHLDHLLPAFFRRMMAPFPYWRHFRLPADRRIDRHVAAVRAAVDGFIAEARRHMEQDPSRRERPANLLEAMLVARDTDGSGLDDRDVAGNVLVMLLAGEDTTANTLAWMIDLLHRNPDAMQRASDEVRRVLGSDALPRRQEQAESLAYVEACAHETMRLKPVAPLMLQQAVRDTVVAGIRIPAGSLLMLPMRPGATDERHFPEPRRFRPERWLADDGGTPHAPSTAKRIAMPFGAGPRLCPGRYLAMLEIKMVIAMLYAGFEIESVATPDGAEPHEHLALTMTPVGLRMKLKARAATG